MKSPCFCPIPCIRNLLRIIVLGGFWLFLGSCDKEKHDAVMCDDEGSCDAYINYSYIHEEVDGAVKYDVEFFPTYHENEPPELTMATGTLEVTSMERNCAGKWYIVPGPIQKVNYPVSNALPVFEITDNLQQPDSLEGFQLDFYNQAHQLIRSETLSVEEWLFLIGEVQQMHYGYLEIDLCADPHDLLIPND